MSIAYSDGASGALAGAPVLPTILNGYAVRPPWKVAGVDYAVGVPLGTALKDPSQISMAGVAVNATAHTVTVTGSNVTLSGYDFSRAGGWKVVVQGANDTVRNSNFVVGANQGSMGTVLNATRSASNFSFLYNNVDGANVPVTAQQGTTISIASSGTLTMRYNYMHNSGGDMIDLNASTTPQTDIIQYNLLANIGVNTAHADTIQWYNTQTAAGSDIGFNTIYQNVKQPGPGNGALVPLSEGPQAVMNGLTVNNDTIIQTAADSNANFTMGFYADMGGVASNIVIRDLYIDPTGVMRYTGSPWFPTGYYHGNLAHPTTMSNVINMVTGAQVPVPSSSSRTSQGYYTYPDASGYSPTLSNAPSATASLVSGTQNSDNTISVEQSNVSVSAPSGSMVFISGSNDTVDLTGGANTVTDTGGENTFVLPSGSKAADFTSNILKLGDVLDLRPALGGTDWNGSTNTLSSYLSVSTSSNTAVIALAMTAGGPGTAIAKISDAAGLDLRSLLSHAIT
jgi:hypothetical protein